jgi:hypothetical protein
MSLEQICSDLRARSAARFAEQDRRESYALSPRVRSIIENNARRSLGYGELGGVQVFAAFVERRTYKRLAAEKIYLLRRHRISGHGRKGWEKLFSDAQAMRRAAQGCRHG